MSSLDEALASLRHTVGAERSSEVLRRLVHLPGAVDWLTDEPVRAALSLALESGRPIPATALLAATGHSSLTGLPDTWSPAQNARRDVLLSDSSAAGTLSADDVLVLSGEVVRAEREAGADGVEHLIASAPLDWRAPLAVAWGSLSSSQTVASRLAGSKSPGSLPALIGALRANGADAEAATALVAAAGTRLDFVILRLVESGDPAFAAAVARAAAPPAESSSAESGSHLAHGLRRHLQHAWETRRDELAALGDALASAADFEGDPVTALEARQQALQLGPSDARVARVAITLAERGDAAGALSIVPRVPDAPDLGLAAGLAYLKGGAVERGRQLLIESALSALDAGEPAPTVGLANALLECGERGLALEVFRAALAHAPANVATRCGYAKALAESGDPHAALVEARLAQSVDKGSRSALAVEVESLQKIGRPAEALAVLAAAELETDPDFWAKAVDCAIEAPDREKAQSLLASPPPGVSPADQVLLAARALAAGGQTAEALTALETATLDHPSDSALWLGLARLQKDLGDTQASFTTLRRAAVLASGSPAIHAALARSLREQGRPSEALEVALQALRVDPRDPAGNFETGRALLAMGRPVEAVEPLRIAHRRIPGDPEARLALAAAYEGAGEIDAARKMFVHVPDSASAETWLVSGRLELVEDAPLEASRAKTAAARLLRARALGSEDPTLPFWLGRAFEEAGDADRAAQSYADFLRAPSGDPHRVRFASLHQAECLLRSGDLVGAIQKFETLREAEGQSREVLEPLARAYLAAALFDDARHTAEALLTSDPVDCAGLAVLAGAAEATGEWKRVAAAYHVAADQVGSDADLWMTAAETSLRAGDLPRASEAVEKSLSGADEPAIRRRGAHVLVGLGQEARAAQLLKAVAGTLPEAADVWSELADVAEAAGDRATSLEALDRVAGLTPDDAEVHSRHAAALWNAGRRGESIGAWQQAFELSPGDRGVGRSLARALVENGQVQAGLDLFGRSLEMNPSDAGLLGEAGLATLRHGSPEDGIELLKRAAQLSPDSQSLAALGEGWLRLRHPDRALEVLERATAREAASPTAWALYAEAALSAGDLATAERAIVEARRPDRMTQDDRVALARAELRLAHWEDALTALAPVLSSGDVRAETALAGVIVRILEADWLFREAGLARRHGPASGVPAASLVSWLEASLAGRVGNSEDGRALALRFRLVRSIEDDEALAALQEVVAASPETESAEALAIALLRRDRPTEIPAVLRLARPDLLGGSWQALLAGMAHLQTGNPSLARQAFVDGAEDAGLRPLAQSLLARAQLAQGYSDSAINALNSALAQWTDEPAWHAALADLYLARPDLDSALPHLQAAVELEPESTAWRLTFARSLRDAGHLRQSLDAYERLLPLCPEEAAVWHEAAELALATGDFGRASDLFDRAASLAPSEPAHLVGKAESALAAGEPREARRHAEQALRLGGERSDALLCLARIAARLGEADRSIELLDRAAVVGDDPTALRVTRTRLLVDVGRAEQAVEELRAHLASQPDDDDAWSSLAEALESIRDYPAAGQALEAALRLRPRSAALHLRLARIERKNGQLDRALDLLHQAERLDPVESDLALEFGQVFEARRELDHALDAYCRSADANPHGAEAFRRAGHVYKSLKAYSEAEQMLARAAELDPADTATLQQLAAVRALELVHGGTYRMAVNP